MATIRQFAENDWDQVWQILEPVFRSGDTYPYPHDISKEEAYQTWIGVPRATFVVEDKNNNDNDSEGAKMILGTYYIKPNQPGQGSHVCNCGYVVDMAARGRGLASKMCQHSQQIAAQHFGFRAMQYNLVVTTNVRAVQLWTRLGFETIGRIPQGFNHPEKGYVDALIMHKHLAIS